ncbi:Hypothetical predicted protein [Pelobates cultripes]|uniref:NXPE C-terminal domain-containing protein n=1 Tax=Pelobates cultripes TaxID=61616 RepID=A0AAD1VNK0_PELCU|nr:Hypothetical predicted protein [Pelobates cultripes]
MNDWTSTVLCKIAEKAWGTKVARQCQCNGKVESHGEGLQGVRVHIEISLFNTLQYCSAPEKHENTILIEGEMIYPEKANGLQSKIDDVFNKIAKLIPNVNVTSFKSCTNGITSKASIINPRSQYCIGENLVIQCNMYDYLGNSKTYGGDFLRSRLYSKELGASVSGRIEDFNNGTYHIRFPLYWKGKVQVSAILFHPSEGIAALWRSRHSSSGVLEYEGRFVNFTQDEITACGFKLNTDKELCEYLDQDDEEAFYCIKPSNLPCESLNEMRSIVIRKSHLTKEETELFKRSNIGVEISKEFKFINVEDCKKHKSISLPKCETGMESPIPSGYFYKNIWNPVYCNMTNYETGDNFTNCLQGKKLFLLGDSTLRQFVMHFNDIKITNYLGFNQRNWNSWQKTLLAVNIDKDIYVFYKRHAIPLESFRFYYFKEDKYISRQIDQLGGGMDTIIAITLGQHFRHFPLTLYIRRVINIRRAIERLFRRSPETKVIIKSENTREIHASVEKTGDFYGYTQYLALREVFQGMNVGFVDAWDMTVSSATENIHPPGYTLQGIMSMTFTFAC